jgi:hypothetical protein
MTTEEQIRGLAAETLALQMLFVAVLRRLLVDRVMPKSVIAAALDEAANDIEHFAIMTGSKSAPTHSVESLRIVEQIRTAVLGDEQEPKHGI